MPRNDLELKDEGWRKYLGLFNVGTLWSFKKRGAGGSASYPGNFIPEIPRQLIPRFTKAGDIVADMFAGSETTFDIGGELGRVVVGCDLRPKSFRTEQADARTWDPGVKAWLTFLHPPYADIIDYNEKLGTQDGDLSLPWQKFLVEFNAVAENAFRITEEGGHAVLVIGDLYQKGRYIPLGFYTAMAMERAGFILKADIIKDFGNEVANKGKNANLWFFRALNQGIFVQEHEHVFFFQRPKARRA